MDLLAEGVAQFRMCLKMSFIWRVVGIASLGLIGAGTLGQETDRSSPPPVRSPRAPGRADPRSLHLRSPLLDALDANHDGVIDADEIAAASAALQSLDRNDDGQLTRDEYTVARPSRFAPRAGLPSPSVGLDNFGVVDGHLLRGAQPSAEGVRMLKGLGVSTIIDLTFPDQSSDTEQAEAARNDMKYVRMPMDPLGRPDSQQMASILSTITNAPGKVFVHCRAGRDRTGTVVACYRMTTSKWTSREALREADQFRLAPAAFELRAFLSDFGKAREPAPSSAAGTSTESDVLQRVAERRQKDVTPKTSPAE